MKGFNINNGIQDATWNAVTTRGISLGNKRVSAGMTFKCPRLTS